VPSTTDANIRGRAVGLVINAAPMSELTAAVAAKRTADPDPTSNETADSPNIGRARTNHKMPAATVSPRPLKAIEADSADGLGNRPASSSLHARTESAPDASGEKEMSCHSIRRVVG
jgi:hypothetical protein